ncbi:MAG: HAD-IIA family hydrolase [Deinococcales bacterium]
MTELKPKEQQALAAIKALMIDMDGVLWHGDKSIVDLPKLFQQLSDHGYDYILATNNSTKSPKAYQEKLASFGVQVASDKILTSSLVAASYLRQRFASGPVFYIGEKGLAEALTEADFSLLSAEEVLAGAESPLVVVGLDRYITYSKLSAASMLIAKGAQFIATNNDNSIPVELGLLPGAGAIIAAISTTTGKNPLVLGKPAASMFQEGLKRLQQEASACLMIGDRLETDVAGAKRLGILTALVLSGVSQAASFENPSSSSSKPDLVMQDIAEVVARLIQSRA